MSNYKHDYWLGDIDAGIAKDGDIGGASDGVGGGDSVGGAASGERRNDKCEAEVESFVMLQEAEGRIYFNRK